MKREAEDSSGWQKRLSWTCHYPEDRRQLVVVAAAIWTVKLTITSFSGLTLPIFSLLQPPSGT